MKVTNRMLHPQLRFKGAVLRMFSGVHNTGALRTMARMTKMMHRRRAARLRGMRYEPVYIEKDGRRLRLCVYRPLEPTENVPGLLWIHGGGYAIGCPEQDEWFVRKFISETPCVVVSPDYRLSVDEPYPAALDDCYAALEWMQSHGGEYGIRPDQLMVGGDSAGGGLAAAVAIRARDEGRVALACQMPLYPMLDDHMLTESAQDNNAPVWNSASNTAAWELYLGRLSGREDVPPTAAPGRLTDFSGLPPAFTFVGSVEPFRDETVAYMENLKAAGVPVTYRVFNGCFHAFDMMCSSSRPAKEATGMMREYFRFAAENYFMPQPKNL